MPKLLCLKNALQSTQRDELFGAVESQKRDFQCISNDKLLLLPSNLKFQLQILLQTYFLYVLMKAFAENDDK